jgi:hypothetical protein
VSELTAGGGRGWEVVAAGVDDRRATAWAARVRRVTQIDVGRYSFDLAADERPEPFVAELAAAGASLVSVTPLRTTLEDVFMERVQPGGAA